MENRCSTCAAASSGLLRCRRRLLCLAALAQRQLGVVQILGAADGPLVVPRLAHAPRLVVVAECVEERVHTGLGTADGYRSS